MLISIFNFLLTHSGCLTQLVGGIDADWASFSEAIERLMTLVRNKDGIESVIKSLDGKLSEAIMHAMTNGPELHIKVSLIVSAEMWIILTNIVVIFLHFMLFSSMMLFRIYWARLPNLQFILVRFFLFSFK